MATATLTLDDAVTFAESREFRKYTDKYKSAADAAAAQTGIDPREAPAEVLKAHGLVAFQHWCHWFWDALPDDKSIRTEVFFRLCDFAEAYFD